MVSNSTKEMYEQLASRAIKKRNIMNLLDSKTHAYGDRIALATKTKYGWKEFTYNGLGHMSKKLACYLKYDINVEKDDRIAILSESMPEYGSCLFASVLSETTAVPLDIKLTIYELRSILSDCQPKVLLTSQAHKKDAYKLKEEIPSIEHIIVMDEYVNAEGYQTLYSIPDNTDGKWQHRRSKSLALIIYTSGTTGAPKGVEITFGNIMAQLDAFTDLIKYFFSDVDREKGLNILSILPMNHLFELTVGFSTFLNWGLSVYYTNSLKPKDILGTMREKNVDFMIVVPAFLKLLKAGVEAEVRQMPKLTQLAFNTMLTVAKYIPSFRVRRFMFKSVHEKFGGRFYACITGGAPLDCSVGEFFETIGIKIFQGYGLTETSPVVAVNYDKRNVMESVGKPMKGYEYKTDPATGELLLKGPSVMKGYHNRPDLTAEVIDEDGWFHTGDVAKIDNTGHIYITGRIKNMIVLNGGKKVFPEEVEAVLEACEEFAEVCVLGQKREGGEKDGTEEIVAIVVPKDKYLTMPDDELNKFVRDEVKKLSMQLAPYKRPVNIVVSKEKLPRTTTRKVKRQEVKKILANV